MSSALALPNIAFRGTAARGRRYAALDAWRGLAALSVVYGHQTAGRFGASLFVAFYLAVDFFFVLSGFVLAHPYWDELTRTLRLAPLLYLGSLSYAICLVHWPLLFVMVEQYSLPSALYYLAVFAAAILTHHAVEVPARRFILQYANRARAA